jgi:hypothetical protein
MNIKRSTAVIALMGVGLLGLATYSTVSMAIIKEIPCDKRGTGKVLDEAKCVGRTVESMPGADEDYYRDMDNGATKDPVAIAKTLTPFVPGITPEAAAKAAAIGRNNWIVWTAGNDYLWNKLSYESKGNLDFLKTLSNHPSLNFSRSNRWNYLGLVNEPCFEKPTSSREDRYGLWLDVRSKDCPRRKNRCQR